MNTSNKRVLNVLGTELESCCTNPVTGFYRNGFCHTGPSDFGTHIVCAKMTTAFLEFSKSKGNDLMSPRPEHHFLGLKQDDIWCLCISRWIEALNQGIAPPIMLKSTHQKALEYVDLELLKMYATDF